MDVFEFALEFEKENKEFYRECAEKADHNSLKRVFNYLADEEEKHEEIVKQLQAEETVEKVESDIIPKAKKAFDEIAEDLPERIFNDDQLDAYQKALELEKRSVEFYQSKLEEAELPQVKKVFRKLANIEKNHQKIMENIYQFVSKPERWLDDAEWYHLEEY